MQALWPRPFLLALLVSSLAWAGCMETVDAPPPLERADWEVGDRWVYLRTTDTASGLYVRTVTGLLEKRGHQVFEVTEGLQGHPIQQYSLYTVGRLRFMGMEVRETGELRTAMDPEAPLPFHYVFPLEPGSVLRETGHIRQSSGSLAQRDTVELEARVLDPMTLRLGERVYDVTPYEIRIRYTTTPFDDVAIIRGHWSAGVGQSVLTTVIEAGETRTYELLSFTRATPRAGPPVYDLVPPLTSTPLMRGFDAGLDAAGYARHLFHVEEPTSIGVRFSLPAERVRADTQRMDLIAIRPLGYARAGIAENVSQITEPGVVLHLAAAYPEGAPVVFHSPTDHRLDAVRLEPGQVYELLVASNVGNVRAEVVLGDETQRLAPVETGGVDVLAVAHKRERRALQPGPQNHHDRVQAIVAVPEGARIEGLVFAIDHGETVDDPTELGAMRRVTFSVDGSSYVDRDAVYGFYLGHDPRGSFTVEAGYEYRAEMALRGVVDYEMGALLMRLVGPND